MAKNLHTLPNGYLFSDYRIESVLGQGGFGITYLALDINLDSLVAIKEYFPREFSGRDHTDTVLATGSSSDQELFDWGLKRFLDEARILARFKHPNIISVRRYFEANGTAYLVMDYCDGKSLDKILEESKTISPRLLDQILWPLLDALQRIHSAGLLHRDIKPANIFVRNDGTPVLLDFGAARQEMISNSRSITSLASPGYAAFEQYSTHGKQGPWSDIYGLSASLYRALSGAKPPDSPDRILNDTLAPLLSLGLSGFKASTVKAIDAGLAIKPADRPQTVEDWRRIFEGESAPREPTSEPREALGSKLNLQKEKKQYKYIFAGILVCVCLGVFYLSQDEVNTTKTEKFSPVTPVAVSPSPAQSVQEKTARESAEKKSDRVDEPPIDQKHIAVESKPNAVDSRTCRGETKTWNNCRGVGNWGPTARYEGEWLNGLPSGKGRIIDIASSQIRYEGEVLRGFLSGTGTEYLVNGDRYVGGWTSGKKSGRGIYYYANGDVVEGEFKDDMANGAITFRAKSGDVYNGNALNGKFHGVGTFTYRSGARYVGEFVENRKSGRGIYYYESGDVIEGEFKDDRATGAITYKFKNGDVYTGNALNGKFHGFGTYTFKSGARYVGNHVENQRSGSGAEYRADGTLLRQGRYLENRYLGQDQTRDNWRQPSRSFSRLTLRTCQNLAQALSKNIGRQIDANTTVKDHSCRNDSGTIVLTYTFETVGADSVTQREIDTFRNKMLNETLCGKQEVRDLLSQIDMEYQYRTNTGIQQGLLRFTDQDCR